VTGRQFATALFLLLGATVCAPFAARAECRSEAGFTACPDADFKRLMEKLAAARGEAKTCAADLSNANEKAVDTQRALDAALALPATTPAPRTRVPFLLGTAGATLLAGTPWLTSSAAGRASTASAGFIALVLGWYASEQP
jgi:hypothetical protein